MNHFMHLPSQEDLANATEITTISEMVTGVYNHLRDNLPLNRSRTIALRACVDVIAHAYVSIETGEEEDERDDLGREIDVAG